GGALALAARRGAREHAGGRALDSGREGSAREGPPPGGRVVALLVHAGGVHDRQRDVGARAPRRGCGGTGGGTSQGALGSRLSRLVPRELGPAPPLGRGEPATLPARGRPAG